MFLELFRPTFKKLLKRFSRQGKITYSEIAKMLNISERELYYYAARKYKPRAKRREAMELFFNSKIRF